MQVKTTTSNKKSVYLEALCNDQTKHSLNAWKNARLSADWEEVLPAHRFLKNSKKNLSPPMDLRGKVSKTPELIYTMYRSGEYLNVSVVKNRSGRAFADGSNAIRIPVDLSRMRLG